MDGPCDGDGDGDGAVAASTRVEGATTSAATTTTTTSTYRRSSLETPRPRNPFSRRDRNHFPAIDDCLAAPTTGDDMNHGDPFVDNDDDNDDGCSVGCNSSTGSFTMMSIGARAALAEHMRHIAKHGIDGEATNHNNEHENEHEISTRKPQTLLDMQWERFLLAEGHRTHSSTTTTTKTTTPTEEEDHVSRESTTWHFDIYAPPASAPEQSIEVMTDVSMDYDFFNSQRVKQLATPERNLGRTHFLSSRNDDRLLLDDDDDSDDDSDSLHIEATDRMAPELWMGIQHHGLHDEDDDPNAHSPIFQSPSFGAPDLSRISSADDSEPQHSLLHPSFTVNDSLPLSNAIAAPDIITAFFQDPSVEHTSIIFGSQAIAAALEHSASLRVQPIHFTPSRQQTPAQRFRPRLSPTGSIPSPLHAEASFDQHSRRSSQFSQHQQHMTSILCSTSTARLDKENDINIQETTPTTIPRFGWKGHCTNPSSFSPPMHPHIGTSPQLLALDTMPKDFLAAIASARIEVGSGGTTLSPISLVESHRGDATTTSTALNDSFSSTHSLPRGRRVQRGSTNRAQILPVPAHHPAASMSLNSSSTQQKDHSSTTHNTAASGSSSLLTGRKRFRTVVPRRVYLDSPSQQCLEEQDSFGHILHSGCCDVKHEDDTGQSQSSGRNAQRSLLDSFEAAIQQEQAPRGRDTGCHPCFPY